MCLVASLVIGFLLSGCDEPPQAPEPTVDIDKQQEELRQEVDKTRAEAKERVDQVAEQIPNGDTGLPDAAAGSEQAPSNE
jgi:hypothetical protein